MSDKSEGKDYKRKSYECLKVNWSSLQNVWLIGYKVKRYWTLKSWSIYQTIFNIPNIKRENKCEKNWMQVANKNEAVN